MVQKKYISKVGRKNYSIGIVYGIFLKVQQKYLTVHFFLPFFDVNFISSQRKKEIDIG